MHVCSEAVWTTVGNRCRTDPSVSVTHTELKAVSTWPEKRGDPVQKMARPPLQTEYREVFHRADGTVVPTKGMDGIPT
jgi:hypothetical protein